MGTDYGTQRVQDDLNRRNRILERRIKVLEFALRTERSLTHTGCGIDCRAKNSGQELPEEKEEKQELSPPARVIPDGLPAQAKEKLIL